MISCVHNPLVVLYCSTTAFLSTFAQKLRLCGYKMDRLFCDANVANSHHELMTTGLILSDLRFVV